MQLIKEKTRLTGKDIKLKISLDTVSNLSGYQQSINDFIEEETGLSINPVIDGETFKYGSISNIKLTSYFWNGSTLNDSLENAGFTTGDTSSQSDGLTNSFYILQIYDTYVRENQTLLHTSYYNGYDISSISTQINITKDKEFLNLYIPEWYITDNIDGSGEISFVAKLLFYNAKLGKLQTFYNKNKALLTTEDKIYYSGTLYLTDKTYSFESTTLSFNEFENSAYSEKINNSLDKFKNEAPTFPSGQQFNNDGTYTEVTI